jgi:hypothetical protein
VRPNLSCCTPRTQATYPDAPRGFPRRKALTGNGFQLRPSGTNQVFITERPAWDSEVPPSSPLVHTDEQLAEVAAELNARPRKTLGWQTPAEQLARITAQTSAPPRS